MVTDDTDVGWLGMHLGHVAFEISGSRVRVRVILAARLEQSRCLHPAPN